MKKIAILLTSILMMSCASLLTPYSQSFAIYDFTKYTEEGFIISPAASGFEYQPVGEIAVEFTPGYQKGQIETSPINTQNSRGFDDIYSSRKPTSDRKGSWFDPSPDYMLDELVKYAKAAGADGILNFKAVANYTYEVSKSGSRRILNSYSLSGFAVKINKDK